MASAADRLHKSILHALHDLKWESLRDLQIKAIEGWFERQNDLLITANTASGKTEAAFLPLLSEIADDQGAGSIRILYIGPLKALINDQFRRVEELCARAEIPVHRWHGDVDATDKRNVISKPCGVLLITPESLEALFIRRGRELRRIFQNLHAVVIDEMHSFLESERGRQLTSQLTRLDLVRSELPRFRRIGLSATIGSIDEAKRWLSSGYAERVDIVESQGSRAVELVVKTIINPTDDPIENDEPLTTGLLGVAKHVLKTFHGSTNLFFANRKFDLESLADILRRLSERENIENQYLVHHGSLSKMLREHVEAELQSGRPCTALCSSTLEMGIDVGAVDAVGQLYSTHSVSSLKQRLGRSGRRVGNPSRLWLYVPVERCAGDADLSEQLYPDLVQALAVVELLLQKWIEPAFVCTLDLSTLIQQVLSSIAQHGGATAGQLFQTISASAAFHAITPDLFTLLLKDMGHADLIEQAGNGDLILGLKGEELVGHYDFYSSFYSSEEYSVYEGSQHIGQLSMPLTPYLPGDHILLAGRRWEVVDVDHSRLQVQVKPATAQQPVCWRGSRGSTHGRIRQQMRDLVCRTDVPSWLNKESAQVLGWSRDTARVTGLTKSNWVSTTSESWLFTWAGDRANNTLQLEFALRGVAARKLDNGLGFVFPSGHKSKVMAALQSFINAPTTPVDLVLSVFEEEIPLAGKHSVFLSRYLRAVSYAAQELDRQEAINVARSLVV
jgi:ATP-dependent Lhr-like helicase